MKQLALPFPWLCLFLLVFFFTSGCLAPFLLIEDVPVRTLPIHCDPPRPPLLPDASAPLASKRRGQIPNDTNSSIKLIGKFSPTALRIAEPLGLIPLLVDLVELEGRQSKEQLNTSLGLLILREKIFKRIMYGTLKVASAAAEADCEEDRAQREAARLVAAENIRAKRQTQIALVAAGLSSIAGGALSLATTNPAPGAAISITSGVVETLFGGAPLYNVTTENFFHPRNMLRELWENPEQSRIFPEPVWLFFQMEQLEDQKHRSLREHIIAQWYGKGLLGEQGSQEEKDRLKLLLSNGGTYKADDLLARAAILSRLANTIRLMYQDIDLLMGEIMAREIDN